MSSILEVSGLCKRYGSFNLNEVTFDLPYGYIMGFIGPNGAGKTTTIKLILSVIQGDAGSVKLFGSADTAGQNDSIGVVMDTPLYVDDWTVDDVEKAIAPFYARWDREIFARLVTQFGLGRTKLVKELSRGMKVKLQIAAALSHHATLLILDEPTSGLDPVAREEICDLLRDYIVDENKSVIFSTHITSDLERIADYITFILNGSIVFSGTKDALLEKYARITGGLSDIDAAQKRSIIGYREYATGFEGMVEAGSIKDFPSSVVIEDISLEEIIIYTNKGVQLHE